jgi:transcriptional regulator with XRE-family HTH domain
MSGVGEEVKRLRQAKGWTQEQLAVYAGSSQPTVNLLEAGKRNPSAATLEKLARALEVEVVDLFPKVRASSQPSFNGLLEEEQHDYGGDVWQRINLLDAAAEQWQRFADEGLYDLKKLDFELLKAVDRVYLEIVLNHGREAAAMKRASTDEVRARLEQAEQRLIDNNLEFWGRVEKELAREEVTYLEAFRAWRKEREQVSRSSRTA